MTANQYHRYVRNKHVQIVPKTIIRFLPYYLTRGYWTDVLYGGGNILVPRNDHQCIRHEKTLDQVLEIAPKRAITSTVLALTDKATILS